MAHENIPISFEFLKMPVTWEVVGTVLCGRIKEGQSPEEVRLSKLDGWACRDEFFGLPENDAAKLAEFLNKVGVWSADGESSSFDWSRYPLYEHLDEVWRFREDLRDALLYQKNFMAAVTPVLQRPKTLLDLMAQSHPANKFSLRFELSKVAAGVVTITNARRMLFATVLADAARGICFKTCKRKDCGKPFPIESEHARMFCSQYCGHLVSQRKNRAEAQKKRRRARKSLR